MTDISLKTYMTMAGALRRVRERALDDRGEFTISWMVIVVVVIAAAVAAIGVWKTLFDAEIAKLEGLST